MKLDQVGDGLDTETFSIFLGGQVVAVFGFAEGAGVIVRNVEIHEAIAYHAPNGDLLFTGCDFLAGIYCVFQKIAQDNSQRGFRQRNGFREPDKHIHGDAVMLRLLHEVA